MLSHDERQNVIQQEAQTLAFADGYEIVDDKALRNARLSLISAARNIIASGLNLIGVSAPDSM